jgi:hypothetical protein
LYAGTGYSVNANFQFSEEKEWASDISGSERVCFFLAKVVLQKTTRHLKGIIRLVARFGRAVLDSVAAKITFGAAPRHPSGQHTTTGRSQAFIA